MQGHISYRVLTKTTLSQYANKEPVVLRRFRDFAWLHQRLYEQNRGTLLAHRSWAPANLVCGWPVKER